MADTGRARVFSSVLSVSVALLCSYGALALSLADAGTAARAFTEMALGGFGDFPRWLSSGDLSSVLRPLGESAGKASVLLLTGLSVAVAFQVGLFNIGAQGQLMWGGLAAAWVGAAVSLPAGLHLPAALLAAALAGAAWAWIPTALKLRRGVHEVISTIMLNWVAVALVENWLVVGPLKGKTGAGTDEILLSAQLPRIAGESSRLNLGFPLALVLAAAVAVWLYRTTHGLETRAAGLGPDAAHAAGLPVTRRTWTAMALSGALAGLAGAVLVLGSEFKYPGRLAAPYGFDGIAMALIGGNHPLGVAASSLFFGALRAGGTRMQLLGVNRGFPELIQGLALLLVAARLGWAWWTSRVRTRQPEAEVPRA
jgi:simple sugar transport system permease protein